MQKSIIISTSVLVTILVLDSVDFMSVFLNFLLVGELPGGKTSLPPSLMLAIMTTSMGIIIFELLARRVVLIRLIRRDTPTTHHSSSST